MRKLIFKAAIAVMVLVLTTSKMSVKAGTEIGGYDSEYGEIVWDDTSKEDPQPEPAPEPAPQPEPEPQPEPAPEPAPQPDPEPQPEPAPQPEPQPSPQPAPEPQPEPAPEPAPQPTPQPQPEPAPQPESEREPEVAPQPQKQEKKDEKKEEPATPETESDNSSSTEVRNDEGDGSTGVSQTQNVQEPVSEKVEVATTSVPAVSSVSRKKAVKAVSPKKEAAVPVTVEHEEPVQVEEEVIESNDSDMLLMLLLMLLLFVLLMLGLLLLALLGRKYRIIRIVKNKDGDVDEREVKRFASFKKACKYVDRYDWHRDDVELRIFNAGRDKEVRYCGKKINKGNVYYTNMDRSLEGSDYCNEKEASVMEEVLGFTAQCE